MIDAKDQLRAIYGFIFNFVTDDSLVCWRIYLFTLLLSFTSVCVATIYSLDM